jgi:ABC-type dipeptide/oligopeptide/nickel transport system permease component
MGEYLVKRLLLAVPTVVGVVTLVFFAIHLAPGDPVALMIPPDLPAGIRAEREAAIRARYGFDKPLHVQYLTYLGNIARLDLGRSLRTNARIVDELPQRFLNTLQLGFLAMMVSTKLGVALGVVSAVKRGTWIDNATMFGALFGVSIPNFWFGLLLMLGVGLYWGVLPPSGFNGSILTWEGLRHAILPAITLGTGSAAILARFARSSVLDAIVQDYVRTARAKGLAERVVVLRHVLKNALIPIITLLGLQFGAVLSGAVVTETVFAWPGVGRYLITGINGRDFPVVQGTVIFIAIGFVLMNLITDLLYAYIDPRVRFR